MQARSADGLHAYERYAIYWAPQPDSQLAAFGRDWLGVDERTGGEHPRGTFGLDADFVTRITAEPRRYALHATLKAPFRLVPAASVDTLQDRLRRFAARHASFAETRLALTREGAFLALMPAEPTPMLDQFAALLVIGFDEFRAPMSAADRSRRRIDRLSKTERLLLEQWGYPYVLDMFRFHITLTMGLDRPDQDRVIEALSAPLAPILAEPLLIDSICLFGDPGAGAPFRLIERFPLAPAKTT